VSWPDPPRWGVNVAWFDGVDSTNAVAARLMEAWPADDAEPLGDTLLVAARQSKGRGQADRSWDSPEGGLYATWLAWVSSASLAWLPLAVGLCLAEAVEDLLPSARVGLKWPNDLMLGGKKLGGVLCQSRDRGERAWVIVGFGVNVSVAPKLPAAETTRPVSLREEGFGGELPDAAWRIIGGFLTRIREALQEPERVRNSWMARSVHTSGERLVLQKVDERVEGRYVGIGAEGQLELEVSGGVRSFTNGTLIQPASQRRS